MPDALDGDFSASRAVLMGTSAYTHLSGIPAARNSLHRMRRLLGSELCGSWPESRISVIEDPDTVADLPRKLVSEFALAEHVALFYYVGHGMYDAEDNLCLTVGDSDPHPTWRTTTSLGYGAIEHAFRMSRAAVKIAIIDCCFAGLAGRQSRLSATADVLPLPSARGFYLMMASREYATAWFEEEGESAEPQTYFTKYLAETIEHGIAGRPNALTLESVFEATADALVRDGKPEPSCRSSDRAAGFAFARNAGDAVAELASPYTSAGGRPELGGRGRWTPSRRTLILGAIGAGATAAAVPPLLALGRRETPTGTPSSTSSDGLPVLAWIVEGRGPLCAAFSLDGTILASGNMDGTITLWDTTNRAPITVLTDPGHLNDAGVGNVLFNANGWMLAGVNTNSETVTLWDTATRKVVANVEDSAAVSVTTAAFSQGGAFLAVGEGTGRLMIWQVGSQSVYKVLIDAVAGQKTMTKEINSVAFSPDGKLLAASLAAGLVQLWDATTYQEVGTLAGTEAGVGAIAFSPDGKLLAGATNTNEVLLWSMPGRQRVGALTYQDTDRDRVAAQVFSIAFSPDGSTLVAGTGGA